MNLLGDSFDGIKALILNKDDKAARSRPLGAPKTHFNNRISAIRDAAFVELSLVEVKEVKNKTNATVNDVILATCGGALREYLKEMNELPERPLIAMVPISVRKADKQSITNNQVSGMWSTLATHVNSPLERLRLIHEDTKDAKDEHDAVGADLIPDWAEFNNPSAMQFAIKLYASSGLANKAPVHNTIISNVPGPRDARYFAGAKVETLYPIGPVMEGVGLNISLASYQDVIGISIHVDEHLVPKVDSIAAALTKSFAELKKAAGVQQAKKATVTKLQERVESAETGDAAAQVS